MVAPYIEEIQAQADRFRANERNLTLYFPDLTLAPPDDSLNRVFGPPVGIEADEWPTYGRLGELLQQADQISEWDPTDTRMEHVCTIDLAGIRVLGAPPQARAMMLFISDARAHQAEGEGNAHTSVLFLGDDDVERGLFHGPLPRRSLTRWSRRFTLLPVDVPGEVFDVGRTDEGVDPKLIPLYAAIRQAPARLGGAPIYLGGRRPGPAREPAVQTSPVGLPARPGFVMQFRSSFADVNLGRRGVMLVHGTTACVQSR